MSYGGGYNNSGVDDNDWNDRFREQSLGGRAPASPFSSDPFGASANEAEPPANVARFGRPSASNDLESDFDHDVPAVSRRNGSNSASPARYGRSAAGGGRGGAYQSSSAAAAAAASSRQQQQFASSGGFDPVEPARVSRASSSAPYSSSGLAGGNGLLGVSALTRSNSTAGSETPDLFSAHAFMDETVASSTGNDSAAALGAGVGVARMQDPYPSMRNSRGVGSNSIGSSSSNYNNDQQPGATSVARRAASSGAQKLLPPRKEATPIMPPSLAVEPAMPRPKTSRRFLHYTRLERHADLAVAKKVKNARYKAGDDDRHVLKCPNCQSFLKIPKMAVLMQCPTCSTVSPATSTAA